MADRIAVSGAAVGAAGGSYRKLLTFSGKTAGSYVLNDTNFSGLGPYLPCMAVIAITPGTAGAELQISTDNGTTWKKLFGGTAAAGGMVYLDTASTYQIVITTDPADIFIFVV